MINAVAYATFVLMMVVMTHKVRTAGTGQLDPVLLRLVLGVGVCVGLSAAIGAPLTVHLFQSVSRPTWLHSLSKLLCDQLRMIAAIQVAVIAQTLRQDPRRARARPWIVLVAAPTAAAVLFAFADFHSSTDNPALLQADRVIGALYNCLLLTHNTYWLAVCAAAMRPVARSVERSLLRFAIRVFLLAVISSLAWSLWSIKDIVDILTHGAMEIDDDSVTVIFEAVCVALMCFGVTFSYWGRHLNRFRRWARDVREYQRLRPLWQLLRDVTPPVMVIQRVFPAPWTVAAALYRRIIEIRDAELILRDYVPPDVSTWAAGQDESTQAAAEIVAALVVYHARGGGQPPTANDARRPTDQRHRQQPTFAAAIADESAYLAQVSRAVHRSSVVDEVRQRTVLTLSEVPQAPRCANSGTPGGGRRMRRPAGRDWLTPRRS